MNRLRPFVRALALVCCLLLPSLLRADEVHWLEVRPAAGGGTIGAASAWERFTGFLRAGQYRNAYACFSPLSRKVFALPEFAAHYHPLSTAYEATLNPADDGRLQVSGDLAVLRYMAAKAPVTQGVEDQRSGTVFVTALMVRENGRWFLAAAAREEQARLEASARNLLRRLYDEPLVREALEKGVAIQTAKLVQALPQVFAPGEARLVLCTYQVAILTQDGETSLRATPVREGLRAFGIAPGRSPTPLPPESDELLPETPLDLPERQPPPAPKPAPVEVMRKLPPAVGEPQPPSAPDAMPDVPTAQVAAPAPAEELRQEPVRQSPAPVMMPGAMRRPQESPVDSAAPVARAEATSAAAVPTDAPPPPPPLPDHLYGRSVGDTAAAVPAAAPAVVADEPPAEPAPAPAVDALPDALPEAIVDDAPSPAVPASAPAHELLGDLPPPAPPPVPDAERAAPVRALTDTLPPLPSDSSPVPTSEALPAVRASEEQRAATPAEAAPSRPVSTPARDLVPPLPTWREHEDVTPARPPTAAATATPVTVPASDATEAAPPPPALPDNLPHVPGLPVRKPTPTADPSVDEAAAIPGIVDLTR